MTDFSVNKASNVKNTRVNVKKETEFSKLKSEYLAMREKIAKSDFANAPVMLKTELNMLSELKKIAEKENLQKELSWIKEREIAINSALENKPTSENFNAYYKPVISFGKREEPSGYEQKDLYKELMELCKKADGTFDENAELMLSALGKNNIGLMHVVDLLKRAKADGQEISPSYTSAIIKIANAGIKNADLYTYVDAFGISEDFEPLQVDLKNLDVALELKKAGMYDDGAVKLAYLLAENFANKEQVKSLILKLHKVGVAPDTIKNIISSLAVEDVVTGQKTVSNSAVTSVVNLKKSLVSTRKNEEDERHCPINMLNTLFLEIGKNTMIMKDGKVTYTSPIQGENYEAAKGRYEAMLASLEDMMLVDYVSRYKDKNGEIDSKYNRVALALRTSGIVYNQILDMLDSCINTDGSINQDKISSITSLKKAGALSDDIMGILEGCEKNPDGTYLPEDIKNACDLTSAVIGGKEVCSILPEIKNSSNAKEFIVSSSPYFIEKANLPKLLSLAKGSDGSVDVNALELLSDLEYNLLGKETSVADEEQFVSDAEQIIRLARAGEDKISDDATGICAILCQNGESAKNIEKALKLCSSQDEKVDAKLASVLWNMGVQKAPFEEIESAIKICINQDGTINNNNANILLSLFDSGYTKEQILSFISK